MKNKLILLFSLLLGAIAAPAESLTVPIKVDETGPKMLKGVHSYLEFIHQISQEEDFSPCEALAPDLKKVFNGKLYTTSRDEFVSDLLDVTKTQGRWSVDPVDIIVSGDSRCAVLRLMIEMEGGGAFTAIVILRFNSDYLITEINEVFSKIDP